MDASPEGAPVGRRAVLGLIGLGALGVITGSKVQAGLSELLAPVQLRDPTGFTSMVPLGNTWRYYSVTGEVEPRAAGSYTLKVSGLVDRSATYSYADLEALPQLSFTDTFQCVTGWHVPDVPWRGVRVADLLERAAPTDEAVGVRFRSFDGVYSVNMTLDQARADDVIVALRMYGKPVTHDHGGPVRIYSGSMYGYKSTKWLSEIEVTPDNRPGYWEDRGYPLNGIIGE
ncbi:molybdopterin-dependent oxidoreductase [Mumia sp. zg.B21]|uniref:molybdopterin-dependent oxidoreductase n=1 Tax=Mumia sp. zg.B21 TaxID=2855447 RepID=UPI001C6F4952|nr:molybdopterin-dependent oxidoreductase [Mumia sp. zg.B21]MBW9210528.1 molybdopterin-dependent oxidoreductase [Mumia sp. zg.B21]